MPIRSLAFGASESHRRWRARGERLSARQYDGMRLAVTLWLVLAAAITVRTIMRPTSHTVFPIFAASADHWWNDRPLYQDYPPLDNFRYPPLFALLMTPFVVPGPVVGGILWSWAGMAVFLVGLWGFVRDVVPVVSSAWTRQRTAVFLVLAALGALRGLWNAQSNALIVGLFLMGAAALVRALEVEERTVSARYWWLAALLLAASVCLKLTPMIPVALLCVLWPRQLVGRFLVMSVLLFLVPFLSRPPDVVLMHYQEWIDHLSESSNARWLGFRDGWTVCLVMRQMLGGGPGPLPLKEPIDSSCYHLVQAASGVGVLLWCLWQRRRAVRLELGSRWLVHVTVCMGLAWLMLFGPAVEHATYVFLAPVLAWAVLEHRAWPHGRGLILAAFALIMVLGWGAVERMLSTWPVLLTALPSGTALLMLWLIGYAGSCTPTPQQMPIPYGPLAPDGSIRNSAELVEGLLRG